MLRSRALVGSSSRVFAAMPKVTMSTDQSIRRKEKAAEDMYVSKKERDQMRRLLAKLDQVDDPKGSQSRTKLHKIFSDHGLTLSPECETALREWKNDGCFTPQYID